MPFNTLRFILHHPLNQNDKLGAVKRYLRWQFGTTILKEVVAYHWLEGLQVLVEKGATGLTGNLYCGLHEYSSMAYTLHLLRKEDVFLDIGANVGSYTLIASGIVGATSFSFEPIPETFHKMEKNIRLNFLEKKVHAFCMGLSEKPGKLFFSRSQDTVNHVVRDEESNIPQMSVDVDTLDHVLEEHDTPTPILMKIDVEGFETSVLRGSTKTLEHPSFSSLIIEFAGSGKHYGYKEEELFLWLLSQGFSPFDYDPMQRKLLPLPKKPIPKAKDQTHDNLLMVRDLDFVQERLLSAPRFLINKTLL